MRQRSSNEISWILPIALLLIGSFASALDSETASVTKSETPCTENCQEDQQDVCEPMVLRHNVKKRSFLLFCNFTRLPEDAFYDVAISRIPKDSSGASDRLAWRSGGHFNTTGMEVENLQPFTRYTVRTVLRTDAVIIGISKAIVVKTKASKEAPGDSPREVYVTSPAPGSIAVAWKEPMVPNAALLEYQLILESKGKIVSKVSINPEVNFHQIRNIRGKATYKVSLRAKNKYGDGPAKTETIYVESASVGQTSDEDSSPLLCATKTSISTFDTDYLFDTPIPVKNESLLTSISCLASDRHQNFVYIVDKERQIFRLNMKTQVISFVWRSDKDIHSIDVDWLNRQLFVLHRSSISVVLLEDETFPSKVFEMALLVVYYGEIAVDPLNGHVFLLIDGTLYSADIPADDQMSSFHAVSESLKTVAIDPGTQSIFAATRDRVVELSYDISRGSDRNVLFSYSSKGPIKEIVRDLTRHFKNFFFVARTQGSVNPVLGSLENNRKGLYQFTEHFLSSGSLRAVVSMDKQRQPLPVPYRPPEDILAVCWRSRCEVTWNAPVTNAGASKSAWDRWDYVLRWRGLQTPNHYSKATIVAGKLRYTIDGLGFGQCYLLTLTAAVSKKEGPKSRAALSCTSRLGDDVRFAFFFVRGQTLILNERTSNGLLINGSSATFDMNFIPREILSRGRDIWCSDTHGGIHHLSNGEWRTMSSLPRVEIFAVEHLTGTLYFVSAVDKWIYRWRAGWSSPELLLRSSRVSGLTVDASRATLYWCSDRSIHRSGLHGENLTVIYSLSEEHNASVITNVVWNGLADRLMFFTQTSVAAWTGQLWEFHEKRGAAKVLGIEPIRSPRRLRVIGESAFWDDLTSVHTAHFQSNLTGQLMDNVTAFHVDLITAKKDDPRPLFPCQLDGSSVRIVGNNWRRFRLEWRCRGSSPPKEKFHVVIKFGEGRIQRTTKRTWTEIRSVPPHTRLDVSIQPLTRWMKGRAVEASLWSPFGAPSAPTNLHLFYRSQRNLNTSKITSEGEACWISRSSSSRPVDFFRLRVTCSTCDRTWMNKSRSLQCFPFSRRREIECLEIQACSKTVGCGSNTTIECSGGKRDETGRVHSLAERLKDSENASSVVVFWSAEVMFFSRQSKIYLTFINKDTVHEVYKGNASIRQMASDWTRNQLFWTEEQDDGRTMMWKTSWTDFSGDIRRLKSFSSAVRNLTIFSLSGKIQWLMPEANKSFDGDISGFRGLSLFANKYLDDDVASCRAWLKDSVTCDHPASDRYTVMIQTHEDRIVEFSEESRLCRHLKIRGNAQGHKSLSLIQRCYVAREPRSSPSKATAPLRRRRQQPSPYDMVILSAVTSDRRLLSIRRDSGEMVATEKHPKPIECANMAGTFQIFECGPHFIRVKWTPHSTSSITRAVIQIQAPDSQNWTSSAPLRDPEGKWSYGRMEIMRRKNSSTSYYIRKHLEHTFEKIVPNKVYSMRVGLIKSDCDKKEECVNSSGVYHYPESNLPKCSCRSRAATPAPPTKPNYHYVDKTTYQLNWDRPDSHGSEIFSYIVDRKDNSTNWKLAKKVAENKVLVPVERPTDFRVRAQNSVGISAPSPSIRIVPNQQALRARIAPVFSPVVMGLAATLFVIFIAIIIGSICWYRRKKRFDHRRSHLNQLTMQMEMRNLNGSPGPAEVNALYANATKMEAIERLPRISRHQLEIASNKYLGAGAFGQVWEGIARGLFPDEPERSLTVAMKTLRRGATSQERDDFLQEAQLMANFNHDHIVRLLGVCLEGEPQFIILELMNKGDLKSYLRASRPSLKDSLAALSVSNLLGIIIDVAKGCAYLEEQHFVHRDIAARNCLVTYRPDGTRVTKIGDFGLARDVYRSDYYRNKRKEAMLPVRWMSPEALVDGLFSSQSDVWAYGVLCWEVMTLGQQPYAAKNHSQVMRFVRAGGVLDRPSACPEQLYQLMILCWSFSSQLRPTFVQILNSLFGFEAQTKDPYSPFSQPFYFQNYVTQDFAAGGTAGSASSSSEDSSECTSNLLCPAGDDACDLPGGSCYETPISRPYLDVKTDMVHYVNSQVVVAMPPLMERHRPLSIDASRPSTAQIMALGPPPVPRQPDVNYRSIRVEEPEASEYQTPDGAAAAPRENPDESRGATAAAPSSPYATPASGYSNVRPSVISQTATLRSTASSSNGDSSMTASTGSRSSGVLPSAAAAMEMARDHPEMANNNNGAKGNERSGLRVPQANGNVSAEDYATRHYDRL